MIDLALGLAVGPLPSKAGLAALRALGLFDIVNVSGVPSAELWPAEAALKMRMLDFRFRDAFTAVDGLEPDPMLPAEFEAFRAAIAATADLLSGGRPCGVFCHRGVGRSPLVAAAALIRARAMPRDAALQAITRLRPEARFSAASLAALDAVDEHDTVAGRRH